MVRASSKWLQCNSSAAALRLIDEEDVVDALNQPDEEFRRESWVCLKGCSAALE